MKTLHTIDYSDAQRIIDLIVNKALQMQKACGYRGCGLAW